VGNRLGNSSDVTFASGINVSSTVFFFQEMVRGCLIFVIEDAGGNGFPLGSYSVSLNGQEIITRSGDFWGGERVSFGNEFCPTTVTDSSVITVLVLLDARPTQSSFYIGDSSGDVKLNGTYFPSNGEARSVAEIIYNPKDNNDTSDCFTFTIMDSVGDGICCGSGRGRYTIDVGWTRLVFREINFGFGERLRFGEACPNGPLEIIDGFSVSVDIVYDFRPNQTTWRLEEDNGNLLAGVNGSQYDALTAGYIRLGDSVTEAPQLVTSEQFFLFPERNETNVCLQFFIEDSAGNGICCSNSSSSTPFLGDGNYSLSVNGSVVFTSNGEFQFGEQVAFGKNCTLSVSPL